LSLNYSPFLTRAHALNVTITISLSQRESPFLKCNTRFLKYTKFRGKIKFKIIKKRSFENGLSLIKERSRTRNKGTGRLVLDQYRAILTVSFVVTASYVEVKVSPVVGDGMVIGR